MSDPIKGSEKICVRQAAVEDSALLSEIGRLTFYSTFAEMNTAEDMQTYLAGAFSEEIQAAELAMPESWFLIAEVDSLTVGYARLHASRPPTCITGSRPVELVRFYMHPKWIGKGLSGALMNACLDNARGRGYDEIWLGVWQENPRAIRFYQKWGFEIIASHTFQLGSDLQTDWLMSQKLG